MHLQLKTSSPNFVDSSQPKAMMRSAMANLKEAIAWLETVTSVRSARLCRSHVPATSQPGATSAITKCPKGHQPLDTPDP